ncbi:hypothetical protein [Sediminispirochaeta smaragdinae]|jgi:hypothetical protein|uniref:Uncharacterized protein n=1 Tax=Sediminispirochaeta smaragdinae (strain DSM 11293 / JCM 15392 / SEBR 4228) TaxID=573413 RepID=E1R5P9_SEDSS|nr:hypothetical protein [Sediminispirochaeta smaragdinae]ADK80664.1 hypothetical protein Spirs_1537 [Sediminispirochaeta smaragdinae DSM 11293]
MKRRKTSIFLFITLLFAYLLLFGRAIEPRLSGVPVWSRVVAGQSGGGGHTGDDALSFATADHFGYVTEEGKLLFFSSGKERLAMNKRGFSYGGRMYDAGGTAAGIVPAGWLPFFTAQGSYLVASDRLAIEEVSLSGQVLWVKKVPSLITAFSDTPDRRILGTLNGDTYLLDSKGSLLSRFAPEASGVPVVYGVAVSDASDRLALVRGIEPQKLSLYEKVEDQWQLRSEWKLPGVLLRQTSVQFLRDGSLLRLDRGASLLTMDLLSGSVSRYNLTGRYLGSRELSGLSMSAVLVGGSEGRLSLFDDKGLSFLEIGMKGPVFWFGKTGHGLLIGYQDRLASLSFERK